MRLRVEREALKKEKDALSAGRLAEVEQELAALEDKLKPLLVRAVGLGGAPGCMLCRSAHKRIAALRCAKGFSPKRHQSVITYDAAAACLLPHPPQIRYNQEKERLDSIRRLQAKRQELQVSLAQAEARGDLARIADIR